VLSLYFFFIISNPKAVFDGHISTRTTCKKYLKIYRDISSKSCEWESMFFWIWNTSKTAENLSKGIFKESKKYLQALCLSGFTCRYFMSFLTSQFIAFCHSSFCRMFCCIFVWCDYQGLQCPTFQNMQLFKHVRK